MNLNLRPASECKYDAVSLGEVISKITFELKNQNGDWKVVNKYVKLTKFDEYQEAYDALADGRGDAFSTDNTEVLAWAMKNKGFTVGIESLGNVDAIAPAVQKGNTELLNWLNEEIKTLGEEQFFHADYEATLRSVYGEDADADQLVVEGGVME